MTSKRQRFCRHCKRHVDVTIGRSNYHWLMLEGERGERKYVCRKARAEQKRNERYERAGGRGSLRNFLYEMLVHAKQRGVRFGREVTITVEDLERLWSEQDACCAYTGLPLTHIRGEGHQPTNASLDKIDPMRGYTPDNVALVQRRVNEMKWDNSLESLIEMAEAIAARRDFIVDNYIRIDNEDADQNDQASFD